MLFFLSRQPQRFFHPLWVRASTVTARSRRRTVPAAMDRITVTTRCIAPLLLIIAAVMATPTSASARRDLQNRLSGFTSADAMRIGDETPATAGLRWANHDATTVVASGSLNAPRAGAKSLVDQAADLVPRNGGRHRVTLRSPSQKMEVDLAGKAHGGVPTPHTKISPVNPRAPKQPAYNTKGAATEASTQQDIRTVRRYLERTGN